MKLLIGEYGKSGWGEGSRIVVHPTWMEVESAVRALDGFTRPFVWFYMDDKAAEGAVPNFEILGGRGGYAMQGRVGGGALRFCEPSRGDDLVPVWTSDQGAELPAEYVCVDLESVLRAARHFYEVGGFDPALNWAAC